METLAGLAPLAGRQRLGELPTFFNVPHAALIRAMRRACDNVCIMITRRSFVAGVAAASVAVHAAGKNIPVGLELFSVRKALEKDLMGTVRAVAKIGYDVVEFFSPYYSWTTDYAKEVRKMMDDSGIRCASTHNGANALSADGIAKAIELNQIIGSKLIVMASAGRVQGLDGWKTVAETLSAADAKLKPAGMKCGFHNHQLEFTPIEGKRPMDVLAENTPKSVVLQLDVGTCREAGSDPVAWINANPGRIQSIHCKDWKPGEGYEVLVGEGTSPWKEIRKAAETKGGVDCYLIEQEGYKLGELETAEACLKAWKAMRV
jgi:sugar phosphate isomerase/epimerase